MPRRCAGGLPGAIPGSLGQDSLCHVVDSLRWRPPAGPASRWRRSCPWPTRRHHQQSAATKLWPRNCIPRRGCAPGDRPDQPRSTVDVAGGSTRTSASVHRQPWVQRRSREIGVRGDRDALGVLHMSLPGGARFRAVPFQRHGIVSGSCDPASWPGGGSAWFGPFTAGCRSTRRAPDHIASRRGSLPQVLLNRIIDSRSPPRAQRRSLASVNR